MDAFIQGALAQKVAAELAPRQGHAGEARPLTQTDFFEHSAGINTNIIDRSVHEWNEAAAWEAMVGFYAAVRGKSS